MSSILDKQVIKLNRHWQAFETMTVGEACTFLCSMSNGAHPGFVMDYETVTDAAGNKVLTYATPVSMEEWMTLPLRDWDYPVGIGIDRETGKIRYMRAPLVVICANYDKVPEKNPKLTREAVLVRDNYTCQYSGRKLPKAQLNLDHVKPRDRGGRDSWENLVACDRTINSNKGNRLNSEVGLKLLRKPVAPKPTVKVLTVNDASHPSQIPFLLK